LQGNGYLFYSFSPVYILNGNDVMNYVIAIS